MIAVLVLLVPIRADLILLVVLMIIMVIIRNHAVQKIVVLVARVVDILLDRRVLVVAPIQKKLVEPIA